MQLPPASRTPWSTPIPIARLADPATRTVALTPDAATRTALARDLGVLEIRKLTLTAEISPAGGADWRFEGRLGATVVQECVVTLDPVTTRIDVPVIRLFVAGLAAPEPGSEVEMPADDTIEPLGAALDPGQVMAEALALALPPYPRSAGAELADGLFAGPGLSPMTDEEARPFAALKGLKMRLDDKKNRS